MFWKKGFWAIMVFLALGLILTGCAKEKTEIEVPTTPQPQSTTEEPIQKKATGYIWQLFPNIEITVTDVSRLSTLIDELGRSSQGDWLKITFYVKNKSDRMFRFDGPSTSYYTLGQFEERGNIDLRLKSTKSDTIFPYEGPLSTYNSRSDSRTFPQVFRGGEEGNLTLIWQLGSFENIYQNPEITNPEDLAFIRYDSEYDYSQGRRIDKSVVLFPLSKFWQGPFN